MTSKAGDPTTSTPETGGLLRKIQELGATLTALATTVSGISLGNEYSLVTAADHNLIAWSMDPILGTTTAAAATGTLYVSKAKAAKVDPIVSVAVPTSAAGTSQTLSKVAVYDSAGVRLGVSADQSSLFTTSGTKFVPLTAATRAIVRGEVLYLAVIFVGGTPPTLYTNVSAPALALGLAAADGYRGSVLTSQTDMPTSLTLGSLTTGSVRLLAARST
jgi:hypothetical protein